MHTFSITADGRLFHDGTEIGTIRLDRETINGRQFVVNGRQVEDDDRSFVQAYEIAAGRARNVSATPGTFIDVVDPDAVEAAKAERFARHAAAVAAMHAEAAERECLMTDGTHDLADPGEDLCAPCQEAKRLVDDEVGR